jgi:dTDP-glucose 4,6-dehydratase
MRLLVTGGAGFIGSALVRSALRDSATSVVNIDKMTYAATPEALECVTSNPGLAARYRHVCADIRDRDVVREAFRTTEPDAMIHLAAETHVDRSIDEPTAFVDTNVVGTFVVLDEARDYWSSLPADRQAAFRLVNVSTDEVFGSLGAEGRFDGDSPYRPNSPYAATKAAADHLARAWFQTYGLPVVVTNSSNNFGPFQFPEKLVPVIIAKALAGEAIPIYGKGANVRDWLHVEDHAEALLLVARRGNPGANYNIGDNNEKTNIEVAEAICALLDELRPRTSPYRELITFVEDRPGHDFRYALDPAAVRRDTGWRPQRSFEQGLRETVQWYLENESWLSRVRQDTYDGQRLGLKRGAEA